MSEATAIGMRNMGSLNFARDQRFPSPDLLDFRVSCTSSTARVNIEFQCLPDLFQIIMHDV